MTPAVIGEIAEISPNNNSSKTILQKTSRQWYKAIGLIS